MVLSLIQRQCAGIINPGALQLILKICQVKFWLAGTRLFDVARESDGLGIVDCAVARGKIKFCAFGSAE